MTKYDNKNYTPVTVEVAKKIIAGYQGNLVFNAARMYDPPFLTWNDFTRGAWPDSIVVSAVDGYGKGDLPTNWSVLTELCT